MTGPGPDTLRSDTSIDACRSSVTAASTSHSAGPRPLVLSLFPGIDLLGRAFELEGFCVVRGPDPIFGGDIRDFYPPAGHFTGIIAGSPCQDFSAARRDPSTGYGLEMLDELRRCVVTSKPLWWLLENVPSVPDVTVRGYTWQRLDVRASDVGLSQRRLRHFQFGCREPMTLVLDRAFSSPATEACCMASEGERTARRSWARFCALQGLAEPLELPGWTLAAKYRAVGNGVPLPMGRFLAAAIRDKLLPSCTVTVCLCGCGRRVSGKKQFAGAACRKRQERRRRVTRSATW